MERILFQGDSITDCGRKRDLENDLGTGYPDLVASRIGFDKPGSYEFFNRGVSGSRIVDMYAWIKKDIINLKPDYISILIGVNDVWHEVAHQNGVSCEKYEKIYDMLISEIKEAVPDVRIMILESFVNKGTATEDVWEEFRGEVEKRASAAKRIAEKHNLIFVPLQAKFDEMIAVKEEPYWTKEGVHPTYFGHELIAREWMKGFELL